ncbi:hypothetical protein GCM10022215_15550 [Nocardioides fonticola]|uniref:Uncharacterized protein n=1 Tax=Nocardioides fonticola TaxID=450363 RepID=A0ABP7XGQ0_9ACTN
MHDLAIHALTSLAQVVVHLADDEGPDPADVKAGWGALGIFVLLCATVAFLGYSLTKQLKKVDRAKADGVFGEEAAAEAAEEARLRQQRIDDATGPGPATPSI